MAKHILFDGTSTEQFLSFGSKFCEKEEVQDEKTILYHILLWHSSFHGKRGTISGSR